MPLAVLELSTPVGEPLAPRLLDRRLVLALLAVLWPNMLARLCDADRLAPPRSGRGTSTGGSVSIDGDEGSPAAAIAVKDIVTSGAGAGASPEPKPEPEDGPREAAL